MDPRLRVVMLGGLVALAAFSPAGAQEADKAREVVQRAADIVAAAPGFSTLTSISYDLEVGGAREQLTTDFDLAYERPARLSLHVKNSEIEALFLVSNGDIVTYIPEFKKFTREEQPDDLAYLVERAGFGPLTPATAIVAELVKEDPFKQYIDSASYQGIEERDGVRLHHVRMTHPEFDWDMWVQAEGDPIIRRIEPDMSKMLQEAKAQGVEAKLSVGVHFREWSLGDVADDRFAFTPPPGVEQTDSFEPEPPEPEAKKLLGKPAPDFTLGLLGGGELSIAKKAPNDIYILDFWATWCGPCRKAMPIMEKVAKEYQSKGVKLFAVNLRETDDEIRAFLKKENLNVTVALDKSGQVAQLYKADAIPQTVIIGKDGTVQVVHVGIGPTLEQDLRKELDALLAGKQLAGAGT